MATFRRRLSWQGRTPVITLPRRPLHGLAEAGFSLVWALIVGFGVLLTALAVASRTFFGTFAASNQQDSRRAREAAEIGAARVVRELNRERNRMLLAKVPADNTSESGFWSTADVDTAIDTSNRCAATPPPPSAPRPDRGQRLQVSSGGANSTTVLKPVVYVSDTGVATASNSTTPAASSPNGERYAYRLAAIWIPPDGPPPAASNLNARWPAGGEAKAGVINLRVQGFAYNNGRLSGFTNLEQQVEVVPKCCNQSLGGNNNAKFGNDSGSCVSGINNVSNGLVIGTGLTSDGDLDLTGKSGSVTAIVGGAPVSPITCVGSTTSTCPAQVDVGTGTVPVVQVNDALPPVPAYPLSPIPTASAITKTTSNPPLISYDPSSRIITINARDANLASLPSNCGSEAITVNSSTVNVIHCRVSSLNTNEDVNVITSDTRWLRFYFPDAGKVINVGGTTGFFQCSPSTATDCSGVNSATINPLLRLQLYGSPTLDQDIIFRGNSTASSEPFFGYFPKGTWTLDGSGKSPSDLRAMLWVNILDGKGNSQIEVPGSGIGDVFNFLAGGGTNSGQGGNPSTTQGKSLLNDFVARAVRQFRLLPGE